MSDKPFKALDHDTREGIRSRIKAYELVERLQNHVFNPVAYPMGKTQLQAATALLGYVLPQLKAVEHTQAPRKPMSREELLAQLAALQLGAARVPERRAANGAAGDHEPAEVRH